MDIFNVLDLIGGLSLFLFGMNVMGQALERRAGGKLRTIIGKMTTGKLVGLLTGLGVTAVIQSSSATTVMVVGFVNSGLMTLKQSINVIMGANIGTTVTAWILSLAGIDSGNVFIKLLKPSSFTPVLALIGTVFTMFSKNDKKKDTGTILLGFAVLMFGMETMSGAVSGLGKLPAFRELFLLFKNPILGMLAGMVLTAIIQSSSASVGILQALSVTGQVSYGAAIPIIMGQNIGTCVTALISSAGANRNARRAALVHLSFNVIGTGVCLAIFCMVDAVFHPALLNDSASLAGIAVAHSAFNILCTALLLPMTGLLEKLVYILVPEVDRPEKKTRLDERLFATPAVALERCHEVTGDMANCAVGAIRNAMGLLTRFSEDIAAGVRKAEKDADVYEDQLGTYLVQLSTRRISEADSAEAAMLLKVIGDFERISDHAVNLVQSAEELKEKDVRFSDAAKKELKTLTGAVCEVLQLTLDAFLNNDPQLAEQVEPLEQVIDSLKDRMRSNHILRMQKEACGISAGFIWSDLLTNLERVSDHCSNIAIEIIDLKRNNMDMHAYAHRTHAESGRFRDEFDRFAEKYVISPETK